MMKRLLCLLAMLAMLASLAGCGEKAPAAAASSSAPALPAQSAPAPAPAPEQKEPAAEPEAPVPSGVDPLTGMPMEEAEAAGRPVAVMLNDLRAAQPQLGVSMADIIYEVPAEGGITRMLAVFQSLRDVGILGSIRSTRAYYLELALGHDALLVHAGGSPEAYADIPAWGVDNMDGVNGGSDAKIFWRDPQRKKTAGYEHSLLTSGEKIQKYLAAGHYTLSHRAGYAYPQQFAEDGTPLGGTDARSVSVKYSPYKTATFTYDASSGKYLVGQFGGKYVDGDTGQQVGVTNVLALETSMSVISGDHYGRLEVRLTGSGRGSFFCGGKTVPIQWSKAGRNEPFAYALLDGTPLRLGRGNSYVCIYSPRSGSLTVQ
jgi:hypothetical protein